MIKAPIRWRFSALGLLAVCIAGAIASVLFPGQAYAQAPYGDIESSRRNSLVRAVESIEPAVASISVTEIREYVTGSPFIFNDPFFELFMPRRRIRRQLKNFGSGFIADKRGYILTNAHVVKDAYKIVVNLPDGRNFEIEDASKQVWTDERLDIAVIKLNAKDLPAAGLGDSDETFIGKWAIALGNPFGLFEESKPSVSVGVISALGRDFDQRDSGRAIYRDMIQTDASINPGNSGGPLVNSDGEVIGINTFTITGSRTNTTSIGIGFAIPINRAKKTLNEVITHDRIRPTWVGFTPQDLNRLIAQSLNLKSTEGVIVSDVEKSGPSDKAGIKVWDIIVEVNGELIKDVNSVKGIFWEATVGDAYKIKLIRQGEEIETTLKVEELEVSRQVPLLIPPDRFNRR